ncbi:hypothetical protein BDA99DRAFT_535665 [Phascolomyces articulosus]|uniref:Uncharacterized protein n=1 Tax=Phascolomyces articulosus TaxID=60185 RepID=A0AAD5K3P8_9FUNG|nr:hypothetical protein BDA99DRAFT_535665 [Phascolomyces articulosus]
MYIIYEGAQWTISTNEETLKRYGEPPIRVQGMLPKPKLILSKLVRVFDMKVIPGAEANEGYYALSYSWNQSGDIVVDNLTGKSKRVDQVTTTRIVLKYVPENKDSWFHLKILFNGHATISTSNTYGLINVHQSRRSAGKTPGIHHMHRIYKSAYCTVALVPEFYFTEKGQGNINSKDVFQTSQDDILKSEWFKRLWTLEETTKKSQKLLIVGQNTHVWAGGPTSNESLNGFFNKPSKELSILHILFYVHIRRSTNDHDRVFGLANIFPDVIKNIHNDYNHLLDDLMIQFYGLLAEKDTTILVFGKHDKYKSIGVYIETPGGIFNKAKYNHQFSLSSWAGISGEHHMEHIRYNAAAGNLSGYEISGRTLRVTYTGITSNLLNNDDDLHEGFRFGYSPEVNRTVQSPKESSELLKSSIGDVLLRVTVKIPGQDTHWKGISIFILSRTLRIVSKFMEISKSDILGLYTKSAVEGVTTQISFNVTEDVNNYAQYVMLLGISFIDKGYTPITKHPYSNRTRCQCYPVITRRYSDK